MRPPKAAGCTNIPGRNIPDRSPRTPSPCHLLSPIRLQKGRNLTNFFNVCPHIPIIRKYKYPASTPIFVCIAHPPQGKDFRKVQAHGCPLPPCGRQYAEAEDHTCCENTRIPEILRFRGFLSRDYEKDFFVFFAESFELTHFTKQYCFSLLFSGDIRRFH